MEYPVDRTSELSSSSTVHLCMIEAIEKVKYINQQIWPVIVKMVVL